jgi:hypothetical protein
LPGVVAVVVAVMPPPNAASAGEGAGVGSANSCIASPGAVVVWRTSSSRRALEDSAWNGSAGSPRSPRSTASPSGLATSAWLRSSSICPASRLSVGSLGRNTCDI